MALRGHLCKVAELCALPLLRGETAAETGARGTPCRAADAPFPPVLFGRHLCLGLCQATNNPQTACKVSIMVLALELGRDFPGGHPSGTSGVRGGPKH